MLTLDPGKELGKIDSMEQYSLKEIAERLQHTESLVAEVWCQLTAKEERKTKDQKPFFEIKLCDGERTEKLMCWSNTPAFPVVLPLAQGAFLKIQARWSKNDYGLVMNDITVEPLTEQERERVLQGSPALRAKQQQDMATIQDLVASMQDPRLRTLCTALLEQRSRHLSRTAAARTYHHARRGGLVEHMAGMLRLANAICAVEPQLNRDLVFAGCLFHDCGKMYENCYRKDDFVMPYSLTGELLGHINIGIEMINTMWRDMMASPQAKEWEQLNPPNDHVRLHLLHVIAAHHGTLPFGSPVVPKTPEAMIVHYIDNIDAKLEMFRQAYDSSALLDTDIFARRAPLESTEVTPLPAYNAPEPSATDEAAPLEPGELF